VDSFWPFLESFPDMELRSGEMLTDPAFSLGMAELGGQSIIDVIDSHVTGCAQSI
jgi:hypothetical protein